VVSGQWTRTEDGVHVAGPAPGRANFGDPPAGDYDLHLEFTPLIGDDGVAIVLSRFGQNFVFSLGAKARHMQGFGLEKGKAARRQKVVGDLASLGNDVRHDVVVEVRRHGASATVNGRRVATMFTADFREFGTVKQWAVGRNSLGLVTYRSAIVHAVRVTPVPEGTDPISP
jgi:hypothetical protein